MDAADPILIQDLSGRIIDLNAEAVRIYGWSRDELLGRLNTTIVPTEQHGEFDEQLARCRTGDAIRNAESLRQTKAGSIFPVLVTFSPLKDETGRVVATATFVKDITKLKHAKERLRRTRGDLQVAEQQLHLAREVQLQLYPGRPPHLPGFDVAGAVYPAAQACGDYFDFIPMKGDTCGLVVGDVTGHGLPPALMMVSARAYLRCLAAVVSNVATMVTRINKLLIDDHVAYYYVSLFVARLDARRRRLDYCGAGHRAYVITAAGKTRTLNSTGPLLGMSADSRFTRKHSIALHSGDIVLLATDGFQESRSEHAKLFGVSRVLDVVRTHRDKPAHEIISALHWTACEFTGGNAPQDDMAAIVLKVLSS